MSSSKLTIVSLRVRKVLYDISSDTPTESQTEAGQPREPSLILIKDPAIEIAILIAIGTALQIHFSPKYVAAGRKPGHPSTRASYKRGCKDAPGARSTSSVPGAVAG